MESENGMFEAFLDSGSPETAMLIEIEFRSKNLAGRSRPNVSNGQTIPWV